MSPLNIAMICVRTVYVCMCVCMCVCVCLLSLCKCVCDILFLHFIFLAFASTVFYIFLLFHYVLCATLQRVSITEYVSTVDPVPYNVCNCLCGF